MSDSSITLARSGPISFQLTLWPDGVARWDGHSDVRPGAWQALIDPTAFARMESLATGLLASPSVDPDLSVVIESGGFRSVFEANSGEETGQLWVIATLLQGIAFTAHWAPLDVTGEMDFLPWINGIELTFSQGRCQASALGLPEGLIVLAGSWAATATAPTLEPNYAQQRSDLVDEGALAYSEDHLRLERHLWFMSPSAAASVMAGSNTNGRKAWQNNQGSRWSELITSREPVKAGTSSRRKASAPPAPPPSSRLTSNTPKEPRPNSAQVLRPLRRNRGGKYRALTSWLENQQSDSLDASFALIELKLGFALPRSARNHTAPWHDYSGSGLARAFDAAGWRASRVNLSSETLILKRLP
jgi:hypothetical protein